MMAGTPAKQKYTFTSYVNCTKALNGDGSAPQIQPNLLPGELETVCADVHMFPSTTKNNDDEIDGIPGILFVTNFKISFVPYDSEDEQGSYQDNLFLGKNDVTLNNIDVIYQIVDKKKKRILPQQKISSKIEALHIICKNFRLLKFSFRRTAKDQGKVIASALARFAYPTRHDLSFAYFYKESYINTLRPTVTMFNCKADWQRELIRCGANEWKVISAEQLETSANSQSLPRNFVIPKCCTLDKFIEFSNAFCDSRSAFWVFSYGPASLVRMAELKPQIQDTTIENITLELVRKCDPAKKSPKILNLSELLPSVYDVRRGYLKFRDLCTPDNPRQFLLQDSKYWSLLDKSGWLLYISACLKCSLISSETLRQGITVVLQENNARDLCCIVSSLTQILLDPYYRTIDGFQSLIQKEWIAMEHQFADRFGHVLKSDINHSNSSGFGSSHSSSISTGGIVLNSIRNSVNESIINNSNNYIDEESPLLLLFLDCVWQLLQQYPEEFEFSQTYLTTIWDSAFIPIFDTFQFNCELDRLQATRELKLTLRPVWDWNEQFAEKDSLFFTNPLYVKKQEICRKSIAIPPNAILLPGFQKQGPRFNAAESNQSSIPKDRHLIPRCGISDLEIWQQCYYRWIPILEIKNGGYPQIDLFHRLLLSNISKLQRAIDTNEFDDLPGINIYQKSNEILKSNEELCKNDDNTVIGDSCTASKINKSNDITPTNSPFRHLPSVNSFFPFSLNNGDSSQLTDILTKRNEFLIDGSIMERLSIAQLPD